MLYVLDMCRLSKTLLKFVGSNLTPAEAFFWCSLLPVLSYLTTTGQATLSVKEWNRKMKIKQRKRTVVIKNLHSADISDQKTKSVYFKLRPLVPLITPLPNTVYAFFIFRVWGGPWHSGPPPYASVYKPPKWKRETSFRAVAGAVRESAVCLHRSFAT